MKIQQTIIIIMLTAIICVFLGIVLENVGENLIDIKSLYKIVIFGFVLLTWIVLITLLDLYMSNNSLKKDMNTYMSCTTSKKTPT
jgi:hypothetical protein